VRRSALLAGLGAIAGLGATAALDACGRREGAHPSARAVLGGPKRIVALGDSLAFGSGASAPDRGFIFRAYLRVLARYPGSRIDNDAIPGSQAGDVLRLQVPRLAHVRADAVVICVGGNDVVRRVEPGDFAGSYGRLVARVRALEPQAAIVCCGVPDVGQSPLFTGPDNADVTRLSRSDDAAVRAVAARYHALFVDLYAATARRRHDAARFLSEDRFHPSDAGHAALADILAPELLRAVGGR
jgi:lysophospholipase L1-like esterase